MAKNAGLKNIILYAEDDEDDQLLIEEAFSKYAANVKMIILNDGAETLNYLNSLQSSDSHPCLIILDINMPKLNGKEALKKIRESERFEKVPVILFTTSSQTPDKDFAQKYNAGFITKPIDASQIKQIADVFLDQCNKEVEDQIRAGYN